MSLSSMSSNYQKLWSWQPRPLSSNEGLVHNKRTQMDSINAQSGSKLDLRKEVAATTAQMILSITV
jgi:hypothetical protein